MAEFTLPELDYDYAALEPHISAKIMELHHSKHHNAYVTGANTALEPRLAEHLGKRHVGSYLGISQHAPVQSVHEAVEAARSAGPSG